MQNPNDPRMAQVDASQQAPQDPNAPPPDPNAQQDAGATPQDTGAPQDTDSQQDMGGQASPDEQAQYNQFVGRAMELVYNPKMFPHVVEMLRGGSNDGQDPKATGASGPAQGLANATAMIITRVYKAAADAQANLSPDVLFHGGTEIFEQLAEVSDKAGISDYANDRDKLEGAYFLAIDTVTQHLRQAGMVDDAQGKAAMQQLQGMDAKGELEQVFRELNAKDQQSGSGAEAETPSEDQSEGGVEEPPMNGGMAPQQPQRMN